MREDYLDSLLQFDEAQDSTSVEIPEYLLPYLNSLVETTARLRVGSSPLDQELKLYYSQTFSEVSPSTLKSSSEVKEIKKSNSGPTVFNIYLSNEILDSLESSTILSNEVPIEKS